MHFVNIHRLVLGIQFCPFLHPVLIVPLVLVQIPYNRRIVAVSYTHLDVYKRQILILAFILPDIHIFPLFTEILRFMIVLYYECPVFCKLSAI